MSRLSRYLDERYEAGKSDALRGRRPNPGVSESAPRQSSWAYRCGYADGIAELKDRTETIEQATQAPGELR